MSQPEPFDIGDKHASDQPASELDLYLKAIDGRVNDAFLDQVNLRLGNYQNQEYWQQVQSFKNGLYAESAFGRRILDRSIEETKRQLAEERYAAIGEDDETTMDRRRFIETRKEEIWDEMAPEDPNAPDPRVEHIQRVAGIDGDWAPPFWRMLKMRHEASPSRGSRMADNLFGRVKQLYNSSDGELMPEDMGGGL